MTEYNRQKLAASIQHVLPGSGSTADKTLLYLIGKKNSLKSFVLQQMAALL